MAIEMNRTVKKPHIWLIGDYIDSADGGADKRFSGRVDNAINLPTGSTTKISGVTQFDEDNILTFNNSVRVIITTEAPHKIDYQRESSTQPFSSLEFEGNDMFDTGGKNKETVGFNAETWYTYNGTDPIQDKSYFYNFRDLNDNPDPRTVGFVLRNSPTGSDLITLKARTFYKGQQSRMSIAIFKIALSNGNLSFYQTPQ
jgi:hypothetical protein